MRRFSLTTKLAAAFAVITLLVFGVVGTVLYQALSRDIQAQDDMNLVLAARHFHRLASELKAIKGIREHETRLNSLVLGDTASLMQVRDASDRLLIEHNESGAQVGPMPVIEPSRRLTSADVTQWEDPAGHVLRGIAFAVLLNDNSVIHVLVAREMSDRGALQSRYRWTILVTMLCGMITAALLAFISIRRTFRVLVQVARDAAQVHVHRLDARLDMSRMPPEFDALGMSLNAMLERLEGGFKRLSQSVSDLAHDMRTPIANMRGASEVALARPRSVDEYQGLIESNLEECERLSRMIENVLFLARADQPEFVTSAREFDVSEELERIAEYFEGISDDAGVLIRVDAQGVLRADEELFRRAVSNLLANALRYTPRGDTISIRARVNPTGMLVSVENPGEPIPSEHLGKLFDRFYRVDPSRASFSGSTGLGLAIVRSIMELHGGRATVESDSRSTRFYLQFVRELDGTTNGMKNGTKNNVFHASNGMKRS
ncbi:heavy metal sensor histidine kinase [Pararobbsia alpina]|uniref:Sensor protein n=1 Tax=Pararobbsia alpina TaxID=621374 RepID=A0A6S7BTL6_9BURK|nr:heavy metal sensor histidine kinase [Pararobbsia alpina]CAB3802161.1 Sensor protein CzcS [Pararobbsia alpina]